jgi:hypothetical protein
VATGAGASAVATGAGVAGAGAGVAFVRRLVLEVAPGVTIAIDARRVGDGEDARAVARAARPLVEELRRRGLIFDEAGGLVQTLEREEEPR